MIEKTVTFKLLFIADPADSYSQYKKGDVFDKGAQFTPEQVKAFYQVGRVVENCGHGCNIYHGFHQWFVIAKIETEIKVNVTPCDWNDLAVELQIPNYIPFR